MNTNKVRAGLNGAPQMIPHDQKLILIGKWDFKDEIKLTISAG